ncbi:Serine/threonine-protein kinase VRK1 [Geodia barretti]|uniref:Serine/threonine-protein kinase VRK1 n=1 Tax=Geodia barretti TaxID=519541 RepID=A0AA35R922_GEOBA|nr:Serine/threonine-protein kinase VRK1 [Geodia barretti]
MSMRIAQTAQVRRSLSGKKAMPPKRKAASKKVEATDSEDEPKSKRVCAAPRPRAKKSRAYKMPPPLPSGQVLTDVTGKHSWTLGRSVGKGGFGEIYRASPSGSRKSLQHVIKIEPLENGPLFTEIAFYCRVAKEDMISSWVSSHKLAYLPIPQYMAQGRHCHAGLDYRFLVMDCFGDDVEKKFNQCGRRFGSKTVCHLAIRILEALEYLHTSEYAHGDIKGSNLPTGLHPSKQHQVYLVDYGLAYRYRPDGQHKEYKEDPRSQHDRTLAFTSIDAHKGVSPSARGDLEILAYCLLQWWSGCLPWDSLVEKEDKDSVARMKIRYKTDVGGIMKACFKSSSPPDSLRDFLTYVHGLDYTTTPDYSKCMQMFVRELSCLGLRDDGKDLDWTAATSKSKTAVVAEECDDDDEGVSSPPPKKKRGTKRGEKTATAAGKPEKKAPVKRGKKGASPEPAAAVASEDDDDGPAEEEPETSRKRGPTGKGRKRKSPRSRQQQVAAAVSIRPARQASGVIPQASYPAALGYVGNGEPEDLEPSTKRPRQQRSRAATAKKSPLKPKTATRAKKKALSREDRT